MPISSTQSVGCSSSSWARRASILGASMFWRVLTALISSGISRSEKARARSAGGTNNSRRTANRASSTLGSSTSQGRICCSTMLNRACSTSGRVEAFMTENRKPI
ncbi:Uncharacterised protein [Bordetella pertussis]|nr:Uncharacterised protein [Bordetella pertussis]CFP63702.1 Uncharacterised protein [Bordetella pertussis]